MKKREEILDKYKWNLQDIFATKNDLQDAILQSKHNFDLLATFKGKLTNATTIYEFFTLNSSTALVFEKVASYAFLKYSEDLENPKSIELLNEVELLAHAFSVNMSFVNDELSKLPDKMIHDMIKDPRFKNYVLTLQEILRNRPHTLSEKEEAIVAHTSLFAGAYSDIFDMFNSVDIKIKKAKDKNNIKHDVTLSNISTLLEQSDRILRKNAFNNMYQAFINVQNTLATNYIAYVKKNTASTRIYNFESRLHSELFSIDLDKQIYFNLIENVNSHTNLLQKYYQIKKQILNVDELHYYDIFTKLGKQNIKYDFDSSIEILKQALAKLGNKYVQLIQKSVNERWIDIYPNKNKMTGAFASDTYGVHPYVLLNTTHNLDSLFTLAHELGHAFHTYFSNKHQPYETSDYPIFLAEIASTANEIFLIKYLYKNAKNNDEKIYLLDYYLSMFKSTLFRQTMFSEFELFTHTECENNKPLSKEKLVNYYSDLNKKYHGTSITHCSQIEYEWLRVPHFYSSFYTYKYSTGIVCAITFVTNILNNKPGSKENYFKFLQAGGSDFPHNILKGCGIDLSTNTPYDLAFGEMKWALQQLEQLIK